jgi:hypothetical protein
MPDLRSVVIEAHIRTVLIVAASFCGVHPLLDSSESPGKRAEKPTPSRDFFCSRPYL